jgi:hypothetical protein
VNDKYQCSTLNQIPLSEDEFVKCKLGEVCTYTDVVTGDTLTKDCECGYNSDGQGYCPKGHNNSN